MGLKFVVCIYENASCRPCMMRLSTISIGFDVLLGPEMERALQNVVDVNLTQLYFMMSTVTTLFGVPNCRITRCGYTGEDGVEVVL